MEEPIVVDQGIGVANVVIPEIQGFGRAVTRDGLPQQLPAGINVIVFLAYCNL